MKTAVVLLGVVAAVVYGANRTPIIRMPNKMEELHAAGELSDYLKALNLRAKVAEAGNNSEPVSDIYNTFYLAHIDVGTPAQRFIVVMDTGSSDFWLTDSSYSGSSAAPEKYDSSKSSTYKNMGGHWVIHYGSGEAAGFKGQDKVCFPDTNCCVDKQIFGQATQEGVQARQPIDGILGLAFQSISSIGTPQPWANAVNNGCFDKSWFTFWLEEDKGTPPPPAGKIGGAITWGDYDTEHCSSDCTWIPLSHELWYEIEIDGVNAGSHKGKRASAISDTGTSFLIGPSSEIDAIGEAVGASNSGGEWKIPCSKRNGGVPIEVMIGGKSFAISPKNYIISFDNDATCIVAMQGAFLGNPAWILGDTFIREWCNSYDMKGKRIGLCKAN